MTEKQIALDVVQLNGKTQVILPEAKITGLRKIDQPVAVDVPTYMSGIPWAPWGENDLWPTEIRQKMEDVPMVGTTIARLVAMMYGEGLAYQVHGQDPGAPPVRIPQVDDWLRKNQIHRWFIAQAMDYRLYMNCFSELKLNRARTRIDRIFHKSAEFIRIERQNSRSLKMENVFYSPYFGEGLARSPQRRATIALVDQADPDGFFEKNRRTTVAYHSHFPTSGRVYYARPYWIGLFRKSGWIDVAKNVPEIITAMQRNQVAIKYQILIPETYFEIRHPDWPQMTADKRVELIDEKIDNLNTALSSTDNLFKSVASVFKQDPLGNPIGKIEIVAVDDKIKKGAWVPDSNAADAQIVQGLGMHPSQVGLAPEGGKMGAGSGSDQRESYNTQISLNTIDQQIVLEPLQLIARVNGWPVDFYVRHQLHVPLNTDKSGIINQENPPV